MDRAADIWADWYSPKSCTLNVISVNDPTELITVLTYVFINSTDEYLCCICCLVWFMSQVISYNKM